MLCPIALLSSEFDICRHKAHWKLFGFISFNSEHFSWKKLNSFLYYGIQETEQDYAFLS